MISHFIVENPLLVIGSLIMAVSTIGLIYNYRSIVIGYPIRRLTNIIPERMGMLLTTQDSFADNLDMQVTSSNIVAVEREKHFGFSIELSLTVITPPVKITDLYLLVGNEVIEPVGQILPFELKQKTEQHTFRFEVSHVIAREATIRFNWYEVRIYASIRGHRREFCSGKFIIPSSSSL